MSDFDDLPWENILEISKRESFESSFPNKERVRFVLNEENYPKLVESALKSLKKKNPEATEEQARELADLMKAFARKVLEEV